MIRYLGARAIVFVMVCTILMSLATWLGLVGKINLVGGPLFGA